MASSPAFPYFAKATLKYKSPHKQDLTFAKGETIKITGAAPKASQGEDNKDDSDDDDDDWLVGESLDGSRQGTFPGGFVAPTEAPLADASGRAGAIPAEAPAQLQSSVLEEEPVTHEAPTVSSAAKETAQKGVTDQTGFGAPLPPRPVSPDAEPNLAAEEISSPGEIPIAAAEPSQSMSDSASVSPIKSPSSKSPPPVTAKPTNMSSSFRDRLAAFNKPADSAPPPLPKSKPGGWKRPTPSADAPPLVPSPAKAAPLGVPKAPAAVQADSAIPIPDNEVEPTVGGGFSAADAQSSIKMSLKERMAALQRNESAAADATPDVRPKPAVPGKIGADKRSAAMQGMGLAPPSAPARKLSSDSYTSSQSNAPADMQSTATISAESHPAVADSSGSLVEDSATETRSAADVGESVTGEEIEAEEQTEEQKEAERRAAIAKRMAALGARRMGGGPAGFAPRTVPTASSSEGTTSEPGIQTLVTPAPDQSSETAENGDMPSSPVAENEPKILSVPRRTAAPRKKRSAGPSAAAVTAEDEQDAERLPSDPTDDGVAASTAAAEAMDTIKPSIAAREQQDVSDEAREAQTTEDPEDASKDATADGVAAAHAAAEAMNIAQPEPSSENDSRNPTADGVAAAHAAADAMGTHIREESINDLSDSAKQGSGYNGIDVVVADKEGIIAQQTQATDQDPTEESDGEIAEHQRQLEEYLRGEGFFEGQTADADAREVVDESPAMEQAQDARDDRSIASPNTPSRPTSTRPPVPRTSLPPPPTASLNRDGDAIPKPATPSGFLGAVDNTSTSQPLSAAPEEMQDPENESDDLTGTAGPILAAPRARMAVPTDDPEDEQILAAAEAAQESGPVEHDGAVAAEPDEVTQEEQESQRRANLARRMAALGGQRIGAFPGMAPPPIMGAPMPVRSQTRPVEDTDAQEGFAADARSDVADREGEDLDADMVEHDRVASPGIPAVPTSPPPKPMSPPPPARPLPPVLPPGRPSSTAPMGNLDEVVRSATPVEKTSLARSSSKPPVPRAMSQSRDMFAAEEEDAASNVFVASPPLPPTSPPPRPSSRAPALPGAHRRQGSAVSNEVPAVSSSTDTPASETVPQQPDEPVRAAVPVSTSSMSIGGSDARQSSRDLDLMPSSRWWRHGMNPLRLPSTVVGRPDAILYVDTSPKPGVDPSLHQAAVHVLFDDYSTTVVRLAFMDDDAEESQTSLTQAHSFPPNKPSVETLRQWSTHIGSVIAKLAVDACKQTSAPIADGSARGFVQAMLASMPGALPSVGYSFGVLILTQVGPTMMQPQLDEVRPGDCVSCSQADFRGKKGLAPYHMTFGSQSEPTIGIVTECETKKNKLRCIIQSPHNKKGLPDEVSLRLDDLKSGIVKVFRVPPRQGWVQDW